MESGLVFLRNCIKKTPPENFWAVKMLLNYVIDKETRIKIMFKLLYRTGKTEKEFSKLKWAEKSGQEDNFISPFFQEYLKNIFPELKLFIFEENGKKTTKYYLKKAKKILDAIAWYPKGKFFIIFEYKSKEPHKKMEQIRGYLGAISDGENKDCIELVDNLNINFPKEKGISWKYGEVDWDETRILWISPSLPSKKNASESWCYENPKIIWGSFQQKTTK